MEENEIENRLFNIRGYLMIVTGTPTARARREAIEAALEALFELHYKLYSKAEVQALESSMNK